MSKFPFWVAVLVAGVCVGCLGRSSAVPSTPASGVSSTASGLTPGTHRGTLSGLVVISGGKTEKDNGAIAELRPVKDAPVTVTGRTIGGARFEHRSTTDNSGRFQLNLPPGRYMVFARIFPATPVQPHKRVFVAAGDAVRIRITGYVF